MTDSRKDLPSDSASNFAQRVRETLMTYMGRQGNPLDRGLTLRDLIDAGIVALKNGANLRLGNGALPIRPGDGIDNGNVIVPETLPDLTPPPTPTGFTATAGLTQIFLECDTPLYTQGRGHMKTVVYGAIYTEGPLPTFADAVEITEFTGTVFSYATPLGTQWHLWAKWVSNDGVESTDPAGGTNGVEAKTGKIGNSDLGPLIVEAGNLAAGAVTASKFAISIEPVTLVPSGSLPTVKSTSTIYYGPDAKLYRWNGSAYVSSVPAVDVTGQLTDSQLADIAAAKLTGQITSTQITDNAVTSAKINAGAVTAGKIAAGAIVADNIAAGSITTAKLAAGAVTANEIAANTITSAKIAANAITAGELAAGAVTAGKIAANAIAVGTAAIQNGAIVNAMIGNATIDSAKIASLSASKLTAGTINTGDIQSNQTTVVGGVSVPSFKINGSTGYAEFNNVTVRGTVYASAGSFTGTVSASTINGSTFNGATINSGAINIHSSNGGANYGFIRSLDKWWNDASSGWILARDGTDGATFVDFRGGNNRIWMSSWNDCGITFPGITMTQGGLTISQANVINTLNIGNEQVTVPRYTALDTYTATTSITVDIACEALVIATIQVPNSLFWQRLKQNGSDIRTEMCIGGSIPCFMNKVSLTAGTHTFTISNDDTTAKKAAVYVLATKR